ncbi:MAG: PilW family protein [Thiomonas sp.]
MTTSIRRSPGMQLQRGLSLIELMVALVIGLIFAIAVLLVQSSLTKQNVQMSDVMQRDTQTRAALDLISRDLSNAGYMLDGVQPPCAARLAFDSAVQSTPFFQYPVSAVKQASSTALPTATTPAPTPGPTYVPPGGGETEMISITGANSARITPTGGNPTTFVVQNTVATSQTANAVQDSTLPLNSVSGIAVGDTAQLRMPLNQNIVCFRVPVAAVDTTTTPPSITSMNSLFPSNAYSGFNNSLQSANLFPTGVTQLQNANLAQARLADGGPAATSPLKTVVYYVANAANAASGGTIPMLMRATLNASNDQMIGTPLPLAAGVVSLQVRFGVDETNSGQVTNYLRWSNVVTGHYTNAVRSVLFAVVSRTLHADPSNPQVTSVAVPSPMTGAGNDMFVAYTPTAAEQRNRFSVIESEFALRNTLWPH